MHKALFSTAMIVMAISTLAMPATAGASNRTAQGSSHAIILQNHASTATARPRQLPPNPCKTKPMCR